MYRDMSLAVVIPAYNEAGFVGDVIDSIPPYVDTVFVVDDASTDETWSEVQQYVTETLPEAAARGVGTQQVLTADGGGEDDQQVVTADGADANEYEPATNGAPEVVAARHEMNRGRGGAVKTGYRLGLTTDHEVIAVIDGDGQMDPGILHRFVEPIATDRADYTKGNRLSSPHHFEEMSTWRLFGNRLLTLLTRIASGNWEMQDPQNGYTAITAEALGEIPLPDLYDGYGFLNDMLVQVNVRGLKIVEVPMSATYGDESSGIRYRSFVPRLSLLLLHRFLWRFWMTYMPGADPGTKNGRGIS